MTAISWRAGGLALVACALLLGGCGGNDKAAPVLTGPTADSGCGLHSGPYSDAVSVTGDFGGAVDVDFPTGFKPTGLERTILTPGSGKPTKDGSAVQVTVSVFNGRTGDLISQQSSTTTIGDPVADVLAAGVRCVPIGSRVISTAPAADLFGSDGNSEADIAAADGVVVVTDVAGVVRPPKAEEWDGAPAVTFRGRKSPQVSVPTGTPPSSVVVDVIRPGTGQVVQAGAQVTLNFKTMIWGTGKVIVETYGKDKAPVTYPTNAFVPGLTAALLGQRVGAQLVVAVPPEFGYGAAGAQSAGVSGTDTLLFVVEIEATRAQGS